MVDSDHLFEDIMLCFAFFMLVKVYFVHLLGCFSSRNLCSRYPACLSFLFFAIVVVAFTNELPECVNKLFCHCFHHDDHVNIICRSMLNTTGRKDNLMFPTWLIGFILGTTNPLTIGFTAEFQCVCL